MNMYLRLILVFSITTIALPQGDSVWQRKVLPTNISKNALYGSVIALYQNYFIVGSPGDSVYGSNSGSVYLYSYSDTNIILIQKIIPTDGQANDLFGQSVCIVKNTIVVGAPGRNEHGTNSGVVYIFKFQNSSWIQSQKLYALNPQPSDKFGQSLSGSESYGWLLVGAPSKVINDTSSGAVFMFLYNGNWNYLTSIYPALPNNNQRFGFAHGYNGNFICITAPGDNTNGVNAGAAYLYIYFDSSLHYLGKNFPPDGQLGDEFGYSFKASGTSGLIGAPGANSVGKVYRCGIGMTLGFSESFTPEDAGNGAKVGFSVGYFNYVSSFGRMIVGVPNEITNGNTGSAYILYKLGFGGMVLQFTTFPRGGSSGDKYGYSVDNNYEYYLVSAPYNDEVKLNAGAVYLNKWVHWEIPVELVSFTATDKQNKVELNWETATELNNRGFEIQKKYSGSDWFTIAFITGKGTTTEPSSYCYEDNISELSNSEIKYRLKQMDFNGVFSFSKEISVIHILKYALHQNYPNPFNPSTSINYEIPVSGHVILKVFNLLGKEVAELVNEEKPAGNYMINFNSSLLSSGVYLYNLRVGSFITTKKLVVIK